jgi:hypothetical protein
MYVKMDSNKYGRGTTDADQMAPWDDMPGQARSLAQLWRQRGNDEYTLKPYQNAESIAAAALGEYGRIALRCSKWGPSADRQAEYFFMRMCNYDEIGI